MKTKIVFLILALISSIEINAQYPAKKEFRYKNVGPAWPYIELESTLDPNPNFLGNWELGFSGEINSRVNMVLSYQHYTDWMNLLTGADFLFLRIPLFREKSGIDFRVGGKLGADLDAGPEEGDFSAAIYLRESIQLFSWRGHGSELSGCKQKRSSVNLVAYQSICKNSRREGEIYYENRIGFSYRF